MVRCLAHGEDEVLRAMAVHKIPTTNFLPRHLTRRCPVCLAARDVRCRGLNGQLLVAIHRERARITKPVLNGGER